MDSETWRRIAFSYKQIEEFVSILALNHRDVEDLLAFGSAQQRCFCTGFYFFIFTIKDELHPKFADELLTLAVRAEQASQEASRELWSRNALDAEAIQRKWSNSTDHIDPTENIDPA